MTAAPIAIAPVSDRVATTPSRTAARPAPDARAVLPGLLLAVLTILFGFAMGGLFGANEDIIKDRLAASAAAVTTTVYGGDAAAAEPVVAKSWEYMQRSHLHGSAIGTAAVALIVVLVLLGAPQRAARGISVALGAGGLGYAIFWMLAGFRAPGLGSTGAAKESLEWLAVPAAGLLLLGTAAVLWLVVRTLLRPRPA